MKIRTDFVTNSSSSSFILGFKSEKDIQQTLEHELSWAKNYHIPSYGYDDDDETFDAFERIYFDCLNAEKKTIEDIFERYKEEREWNLAYEISEHHSKTRGMSWSEKHDWQKTEECQKLVKEKLNKEIEVLKNKIEKSKQKIFVEITYSDHSREGSALEHDIVPTLDCCIKRFSYH